MEKEILKRVKVRNELGLHARPAAQLAQEAAKFNSSIKLVTEDAEVDAKSVLDILSLAAMRGRDLTIKASGPDAEKAAHHLEKFFEQGFQES